MNSLAAHPAPTTHRQLSEEELEAAGVTPDMIQIYPGVVLRAGTDHSFRRYQIGIGTAARRVIAAQSSYVWGGSSRGPAATRGYYSGSSPGRA